ncbi:10746_t:CDS:2 [Funneliformis mosseae]|uniref:10746_t:CDS:1 n=1 Tax=Funneliformis mosseae TaxID=27381 RepID=A0A9N9GRA4_FUNMO|nr:10746_t:CDS:2 [Funneliformis mosseae]
MNISDHHIVIATITNFLDIKFHKRNIPKKISFNFDNMNKTKLDTLLNGSQLKLINQETYWTHFLLNKHWDLFKDLLINAAEKCIPIRKSSGQFKYPRPPDFKTHPHLDYPFNFVDLLLSDTILLLKVLLCKTKIYENEYKLASIQKNLE